MLPKNKNGFILTTAVAAIFAFLVIVVIAGVLVFASINKFALIGGGLIALTLIFGLKGEFNKNKAIFMTVIIALGLFFVLGGDVLQTQFGPTASHVFIDGELGMVTTSVQSVLSEQAYFQSTSGSGIDISTVGDEVKICDVFVDINDYSYTNFDWVTFIDAKESSTMGMTGWANRNTQYCREFTPTKPGRYNVKSDWILCPTIDGWACETLYSTDDRATKEGNTYYCPNYGTAGKVVDGVQICANNKCAVSAGSCLEDKATDKKYYLTVKAEEERCDKDRYVGGWYIYQNIAGGKTLRANVYYVDNDCEYYVERYSTQTQCDDGYLIEGSNLHSTEGDGWECELVNAQVGDPEDDPIEEQPIEDENCNTNLLVTCGDGTQIVDKICDSGLLFDTGATCSIIGTPDSDGDGLNNDVDPDDDNDGIADDADPDDDNDGIADVNDNDTGSVDVGFMRTYGYFIVGGIFLVFLTIMIIAYRRIK